MLIIASSVLLSFGFCLISSALKTNSQRISDTNLFKIVDSKGNDIVGEQLGLLLYKGGTVCDDNFNFNAADVICREMNFKYAKQWTTEESFEIQSNYGITLNSVRCTSLEWEGCSYIQHTRYCDHSEDVFLSCTGNKVKYFCGRAPNFNQSEGR